MSETKILPCPFCGGEAEIRTNFVHHFAICKECNTVSDYMNSKAEAIAAWNRRTPPAAVPEGWEPTPDMVEAARSVVRQILVDAAYEFRADRRKCSAMFAAEVLVSNAMANAIKAAMTSAALADPTEEDLKAELQEGE